MRFSSSSATWPLATRATTWMPGIGIQHARDGAADHQRIVAYHDARGEPCSARGAMAASGLRSQQPDLRELAEQDLLVERLHDVFLGAVLIASIDRDMSFSVVQNTTGGFVGAELRAHRFRGTPSRP